MTEPIFSVSGLRGVVGKTLTLETVFNIAKEYGRFAGPGKFVVGRDSRPSGNEFSRSVMNGLQSAGGEVIDLGICPTPTVVHFVRANQPAIKGGVVITASHNPIEWQGMKFVIAPGRFLLPDEFHQFKAFVETEGKAKDSQPLPISSADGINGHIQSIIKHPLFRGVSAQGLRIGIDAVNGAASIAGEKLIRAFGGEVVKINCSPDMLRDRFPRNPEPTPENLSDLGDLVKKAHLSGGFAFDPDGDRFSCVDEQGVPLGEEATICLASLFLLPRLLSFSPARPPTVVVNLSTTQAVEDIAARFGAKVIRTKVGEAWVVKSIQESDAILGGEGNGGVILPEINLTRDGLVASAIVIGLLSQTKKPLSEIKKSLPQYYMKKSVLVVNKSSGSIESALFALKKSLPQTFSVDQTDGIRLTGEGWWLHIRKSNTEPLVRVICEAKEVAQVNGLMEILRKVLRSD